MQVDFTHIQTLVIKVGSALISNNGVGANMAMIGYLAQASDTLMRQGKRVVIVSSGAIATGMMALNMHQRPTQLHHLQSLAAIGQMSLMQAYQQAFSQYQRQAAQILLTHEDCQHPGRFNNARQTLQHLLDLQVIPVVNENDTVADDEIRFGDNDTLASITCNLIGADLLIILTDQQGLYTANPRRNPSAELVHHAHAEDEALLGMATTEGGVLGSGGMHTKILAARQASQGGTHTIIANGSESDVINRLFKRQLTHTLLYSRQTKAEVAATL